MTYTIGRRILLKWAGYGVAGSLALSAAGKLQAQTKKPTSIRLDFAYYNPVSLVLKEKGWLEADLASEGIQVEWVQSAGSNKALEFLNARSIDFGSTAGAAAFIARANGNPIKSIYVYSQPEWTALVVDKNSPIQKIEELKGKKIAVTKGTDPFIFLVRALDQVGLSDKDLELVLLQHADGKAALEKGDVDAWAGLDPMMAQTELERGSRLFYRNPSFNSYGVLNVREAFAQEHPDYVNRVLQVYEKGRQWALTNPAELQAILAQNAKLTDAVAAKQLERTNLSSSLIGEAQKSVISAAADVLKKSGVVNASIDVPQTINALIDDQYVKQIAKA
ncbi:MAG: aliphatic sulfonate ABC transporter substrate-binding protein [Cyanobacteriota bacterium]|nr:aliphatic sulfonate ABC transporter substrate-binding protein [Cyanobacteriota bacterium]